MPKMGRLSLKMTYFDQICEHLWSTLIELVRGIEIEKFLFEILKF
jgi:hypothetical protein